MLLWMDRTAFRAVIENERTILLAETESMCNAESEILRQADKSQVTTDSRDESINPAALLATNARLSRERRGPMAD